jgi:hypothetical protein
MRLVPSFLDNLSWFLGLGNNKPLTDYKIIQGKDNTLLENQGLINNEWKLFTKIFK